MLYVNRQGGQRGLAWAAQATPGTPRTATVTGRIARTSARWPSPSWSLAEVRGYSSLAVEDHDYTGGRYGQPHDQKGVTSRIGWAMAPRSGYARVAGLAEAVRNGLLPSHRYSFDVRALFDEDRLTGRMAGNLRDDLEADDKPTDAELLQQLLDAAAYLVHDTLRDRRDQPNGEAIRLLNHLPSPHVEGVEDRAKAHGMQDGFGAVAPREDQSVGSPTLDPLYSGEGPSARARPSL